MEQILLLLAKYGYLILFPIAVFEGPVASLIVGFLIRLGYFKFIPSLTILVFGDVVPDIFYYYIGRFGNHRNLVKKYGSRWSFISENFGRLEKLWKNHGRKTMFFSKLAYGLSTPLLMSAGLVRMPIRRFVSLTLPISICLYTAIMIVGYFLGSSYQLAASYINSAGVIAAMAVVIFAMAYFIFTKYAQKKIEKMEKE